MGSQNDELYILSNRNAAESARLDWQHHFLIKVAGRYLEPAIPLSSISSVADIATGTGIWLREVSTQIASSGQVPERLTGFDISSAQFPPSAAGPVGSGCEFVVHDMFQPFPEQYLKKYDLLHVRAVVLATKKEAIEGLVKNLLTLLKPGGHIQWEDINIHLDGTDDPVWDPKYGISVTAGIVGKSISELNRDAGLAKPFIDLVGQALRSHGVHDVTIRALSDPPQPELKEEILEWQERNNRALLEGFLRKWGKVVDEKDVDARIEAFKLQRQKVYEETGRTPGVPFAVLTGRLEG